MALNIPTIFGLFPQSEATGDGLTAAGAVRQLADAGAAGEGHININLTAYHSIEQGTWGWDVGNANQIMTGYWDNSATHALNDAITYKVYLSVGTYTITLLTNKNTNRAKMHVLIDGVDVGNFDMYNAGGEVQNSRMQITGVVIDSASIKSIQLKATDKNAGSSDYYMMATMLSLHRTL